MDQNSNINFKGVQGDFPIKIWTKNSKTPMVNLLKNLGHFEIPILKYNGKSIFSLFKILTKTLQKKFECKYGRSHFKSAFGINFGLLEVVKRKIRKYMYLHIFRLTTSQSRKLIPKADLK